MKQQIIKIICWLTLLLSWLTISPLFVYLARKWALIGKKVRILLLLISPLMLIVYAIITLFVLQGYIDYQRKYRFANNEAIERITGVAFPKLNIIDYEKGESSFLGDYNDKLTLEMEDDLSESTYHYLDSIISAGNTEWSKHSNDEITSPQLDSLIVSHGVEEWLKNSDIYTYSIVWGNGISAPKGESDDEDMAISLSFKKGSKIVTLEYGAW